MGGSPQAVPVTLTFSSPSPQFAGLNAQTSRWLELEQTVNERIFAAPGSVEIDLGGRTVQSRLHPGRRGIWNQELVWLPSHRARVYGDLGADANENPLRRDGCTPLLIHPQPTAAHRRAAAWYGKATLDGTRATPTASFRSVLAWRGDGDAMVAKLSLGAKVGGVRRAFIERDIAAGVMTSAILDTIPALDRQHHRFGWFRETGGVIEAESGEGWMLRRLPALTDDAHLVPLFSLISARGAAPPLLVDMIHASGLSPETFVVENLVGPYVDVLSYLLFVHGVHFEGHGQNVLFEVDGDGRLNGRVILRDFSDASVSIPMRVALERPLPRLRIEASAHREFSSVSAASEHSSNLHRPLAFRARDTVERYGLGAFVWSINTSLTRYFRPYDAGSIRRKYLRLWQSKATRLLGVRPLLRRSPQGLPVDEAIACFLAETDWAALGAGAPVALPAAAEPLRIFTGVRRRQGRVYHRVHCSWGDVYLEGSRPTFFRPAF